MRKKVRAIGAILMAVAMVAMVIACYTKVASMWESVIIVILAGVVFYCGSELVEATF